LPEEKLREMDVTVADVEEFLNRLESRAPLTETSRPVVYRSVSPEEVVEDSLSSDEDIEVTEVSETEAHIPDTEKTPAVGFEESQAGPIAAVDCGIARLGETDGGVVIALRATIVLDREKSGIKLFRTGPLYLRNSDKLQWLYEMGRQLGRSDFFVEVEGDQTAERPVKFKEHTDAHQYADRFRNWLERKAQNIAVACIEGGTILFDGALTRRTHDTPGSYLEELASIAGSHRNSVIGISKQSRLEVGGRNVRFWLDDLPNKACYRQLTPLMSRLDPNRADRILGNTYAARFSPMGATFRVDVKPAEGQTYDEALGRLYTSATMRAGYPDILVRAHTHSYFTSPDIVQLQAQAGATFSLRPQQEVSLTAAFSPFGGRFK
jgi:hypothetical protein